MKLIRLTLLFALLPFILISQREYENWVWGDRAGLSFSTNPVTITSGSTHIDRVTSSISDANSGNLLFYTTGDTVWNKNHQVMANGTGLYGNRGGSSVLILKKPLSSDLYYIFTHDQYGTGVGPPTNGKGFNYSIVDMNLAAGLGSVTVKNAAIFTPTNIGSTGRNLTAAKHCNQKDYWILIHDQPNSQKVLSFLLTSTGLNLSPVISTLTDTIKGAWNLAISPNGKKLAVPIRQLAYKPSFVGLYDFDNSSGLISSNCIKLAGMSLGISYVEFSPDGTKLFAHANVCSQEIYQWDICPGTENSINASRYTYSVAPTSTSMQCFGSIEMAQDGKIYVGRDWQNAITVIHNPNAAPGTCSISPAGQSLGLGDGRILPNTPNDFFRSSGSVITISTTCLNASFQAPAHAQSICAITQPTPIGMEWNFGDPGSAASNTSSLLNPSHTYPAVGIYTAQLVIKYPCYNDTFRQEVKMLNSGPVFSVTGNFSICPGQSAVLHASGNYTFQWTGNLSGSTVTLTPNTTSTYYLLATDSTNCQAGKFVKVTVNNCIGLRENDILQGVSVYPNPASNFIVVNTDRPMTMKLTDPIGKLIKDGNLGEGSNEIDLSGVPVGIYLLQIDSGERLFTLKVIRE